MSRRRIVLLLWILGILLPMGWFTRFSSAYARLFVSIFATTAAHVLMHTFLFAVLGWLVARLLQGGSAASDRRLALAALGLVLTVACLQEGVQLLYKARALGIDEELDITVDCVAGGLAATVATFLLPRVGRADGGPGNRKRQQ